LTGRDRAVRLRRIIFFLSPASGRLKARGKVVISL
jgi:hypothetical protein